MKYRYVEIVFSFLVITMAVFLYLDHFSGNPFKIKFYYIWIKLQDFLLLFGFTFFLKGKRKVCCYIFSVFYFLRIVWQVWEMENYTNANKPYVIDWLFAGLAFAILLVITISKNPRINLKNRDSGV